MSNGHDAAARRVIWRGPEALAVRNIRRPLLTAACACILAACGLTLTVLLAGRPGIHPSLSVLSGLFSLELLAVPWLIRQPGLRDMAGALVVGGLVGLSVLLTYLAGGLNQPLLGLFIALPVVATALLSPRAGLSATLALCLAVAFMLYLQLQGEAPRLLAADANEATVLRGIVLMLGTIATAAAIWAYETRSRAWLQRVQAESRPDPLTGQLTRAQFETRLAERLAGAGSGAGVATLLLIDVDHFTAFNTQHDHARGDELLRRVGAAVLGAALGPDSLIARYHADCFALFCWCSSRSTMSAIYDRIQLLVAACTGDMAFADGGMPTVSIGISHLPAEQAAGSARLILEQAEQALQAAQRMGGNKVKLHHA